MAVVKNKSESSDVVPLHPKKECPSVPAAEVPPPDSHPPPGPGWWVRLKSRLTSLFRPKPGEAGPKKKTAREHRDELRAKNPWYGD